MQAKNNTKMSISKTYSNSIKTGLSLINIKGPQEKRKNGVTTKYQRLKKEIGNNNLIQIKKCR